MPVPRGSLFGIPDSQLSERPGRHIKWDDENLRENERTKTAKDLIDEPDTPWASPPPELFEDDADDAVDDAAVVESGERDERATKLNEALMKLDSIGTSVDGGDGNSNCSSSISRGDGGNDRKVGEDTRRSTGVRFQQSREMIGGDDDTTQDDYYDSKALKARLFEAQRKSLQCTFRKASSKDFVAGGALRNYNFDVQDGCDDDDDDDDEFEGKTDEEIRRELEELLKGTGKK